MQLGLSQRELARRANVSSTTIVKAEHGTVPHRLIQREIVAVLNRAHTDRVERARAELEKAERERREALELDIDDLWPQEQGVAA